MLRPYTGLKDLKQPLGRRLNLHSVGTRGKEQLLQMTSEWAAGRAPPPAALNGANGQTQPSSSDL